MRPVRPSALRCAPKILGALMVGTGTLCAAIPGAAAGVMAAVTASSRITPARITTTDDQVRVDAGALETAALPARPAVTLLGDSVFAGLATGTTLDALRTSYDVTLDAKVCRRTVAPSCTAGGQTPNTGIEAMADRRGSLGDVLVVGLGYNDDGNRFDVAIDALMAEAVAQHVPQVMWLTMRTERYAAPNTALSAARARHPTLLVVDWDAASADHDNWFAADGLHLGPGGRTGLTAFIGEQLDRLALARCRSGAPVIGTGPAPDSTTHAIPVDGRVHLVTPTRLIDTRVGTSAHPLGAGKIIEVPVAGSVSGTGTGTGSAAAGDTVPAEAVAAIMNVTAVDACADGFLTVFPCGSTVPTASNLNVTAAGTVANLVTVALGNGRACIYSMITTDVVVDLAGWYGPTGATLSAVSPRRIIDTRIGVGLPLGAVEPDATTSFDMVTALGSPAAGIAINITATGPSGDGFITAFPCGQPRPTASNVNYRTGQSVSNMAMVPLSTDGRLCFSSHARTHLVVDVFAVIGSDDTSDAAVPPTAMVTVRSPLRIVDTRIGVGTSPSPSGPGPVPAMRELAVPIDAALPAENGPGLVLAVLNVTSVHPDGDGWLAAYPCGATLPEVSNLNFAMGSITPGHVVVAVGPFGSVCFASMVSTDVVVDLIGWSRATQPPSTAMTASATGIRRIFTPTAIGRDRCSIRQGLRQPTLTLPAAPVRDRRAIPWSWPGRAKTPERCPTPA